MYGGDKKPVTCSYEECKREWGCVCIPYVKQRQRIHNRAARRPGKATGVFARMKVDRTMVNGEKEGVRKKWRGKVISRGRCGYLHR